MSAESTRARSDGGTRTGPHASTGTSTRTGTSTSTGARIPARWLAFAVAIAASVMDLLDSTIANVAAPAIQRDLGGSYALIQWISAAYTLAMAAALLTGGRLGDLIGRKRMLLIGLAAFIAASAGCAAAATPAELVAARTAQGAAGAMMLPQVFGLLRDLFDEREMGKALGIFGAAMGLSAMLGPIVAGGLIRFDLLSTGWRMIFLVNVPIGVGVLLLGARILPSASAPTSAEPRAQAQPQTQPRRRRLDVVGIALAATAMLLLVFPLVQGHDLGWPLWLVGLLVASVPALGLFGRHQLRRERRGETPLVEPSIFRRPQYTAGVLFSIVFVSSLGGIVLIFNAFLQAGLGFSPWHSALATAPWAAAAFFGSGAGSALMQKYGRHVLQTGLIIEAIGLIGVYLVLRSSGTHVGSLDLLAPMSVGGFGMGMVFVPLFDIVLAGVEPYQIGSASGGLQTVNSLGMALGVAGLGALFFALIGRTASAHAFVTAAEWTALATIALLATAFVLGFRLPRRARETASSERAEPRHDALDTEPILAAA